MAGYEQRSPHHLSVGEKKRIAIATVLSMSPEILVIDEPTGNLDLRSKWSLISLLKRLPMTKVVATHDLELVHALCPRTIILDHGQIIADDETSQILMNIPLLATYGLAPAEEAA
jgi:cobalt/nickel transport system ATP-binding protein